MTCDMMEYCTSEWYENFLASRKQKNDQCTTRQGTNTNHVNHTTKNMIGKQQQKKKTRTQSDFDIAAQLDLLSRINWRRRYRYYTASHARKESTRNYLN
mmetsp:Transcript_44707/g.51574  ORF Transcript_44707/g.51574 Transcript_44707/m.51574 type:complete len:99 (+) Transcript_44707:598-894(+)